MAALKHRFKEEPEPEQQQQQPRQPPAVVVVTRRHSVVRVPERGDSAKMKMVRRMCARLSTLYTPKCCAEHKPCCSSEWRARFAQRSDALRYCYLVRDAVEGRFALAMRRVNSEADALEERAQMPSSNEVHFTPVNPDCLPGGRKEFTLECGRLGDGSKLQTDGGRSLPSFQEQGHRVEIMHEVEQRLLARSKIFRSLDGKLKDVLTLRTRKVQPATVNFDLKFTTQGIMDAADHEDTTGAGTASLLEERTTTTTNPFGALPSTVAKIKRAVATSLYRMRDDLVEVDSITRACPKSNPCEPYGTSVHGEGMVDHVARVRLQFTGGNERAARVSKTLGTAMYTKTLQAALTKELPSEDGGGNYPVFSFASVTDVKIRVGQEQEPPAWYRAQLDAKVSAARRERDAAYECEIMAKQLVSLSRRKSDDSIEVAVLKESGKANQAQSLEDRIERCVFFGRCSFSFVLLLLVSSFPPSSLYLTKPFQPLPPLLDSALRFASPTSTSPSAMSKCNFARPPWKSKAKSSRTRAASLQRCSRTGLRWPSGPPRSSTRWRASCSRVACTPRSARCPPRPPSLRRRPTLSKASSNAPASRPSSPSST